MDTETAEFESWAEVYREHGAELDFADWAGCIGTAGVFDPVKHLEGKVGRPLDGAQVRARMEEKDRILLAGRGTLPGVRERLDEARAMGVAVGLASSSSDRWVMGHLDALGIRDRFREIRTRTTVPHPKPAPDLFLAVAAALGAAPRECAVLEDSLNGVVAARSAGMFCVAVPNALTRRLDLSGADLTVGSLADITLAEISRRMEGAGVR